MLRTMYSSLCLCCMQALQLLQVGSVHLADALLQCLGCTYRLADAILLHRTASRLQHPRSMQPLSQGAGVLPDALPGEAHVACEAYASRDHSICN